ncbi:class B sortase [Bacillus sp. DNRA2]|uniref:class B sortase n=1 Tax=Bacillus sp. DNRA2 TaxID=2723053 RepID=UPI00249F0A98|nr:class B sortase [Bacillus sp. DNRA2]
MVKGGDSSIKKGFLLLLILLGLSGVGYSVVSIFNGMSGYYESNKKYDAIREIYYQQKGPARQTNNLNKELIALNDEYVGWISIDDTRIDYPVVKTVNNDFYLTHNFYKEKDKTGSIFIDYRNSVDQLDKNTILYGHNMKDNSMFGSLSKFKDQSFFENHKNISFELFNDTYTWEIFSVYTDKDTDWLKTSFTTAEEFTKYIQIVRARSLIKVPAEVVYEDTLLTLSTCTNVDEDERIIIHAKLIEKDGE